MAFLQLPPLEVLDMSLDLISPIDTESLYFIPRLLDKPQNPILDTLRFWQGNKKKETHISSQSNKDTLPTFSDNVDHVSKLGDPQFSDLWWRAFSRPVAHIPLMSWDAADTRHARSFQASAFLSEQSENDAAAGMFYARPQLRGPLEYRKYVTPDGLFEALRWTILGVSSSLHIWDPVGQTFVLRDMLPKQRGVIVVTGSDEVVSESLISRFLLIGTLVRRLDVLVSDLRSGYLSPLYHAFVHSISSILAYNMTFVAGSRLLHHVHEAASSVHALTATWTSYSDLEARLNDLAEFCGIATTLSPYQFRSLPKSDTDLLSHIYDHLYTHIEKQSTTNNTAQIAYIFTVTAKVYFEEICAWVGYPSKLTPSYLTHSGSTRSHHRSSTLLGDQDEDVTKDVSLDLFGDEKTFPTFLTGDLGQTLNRARKSLVLLRAAQPDHPLFTNSSLLPSIFWFWTSEEVEAAFCDEQAPLPAVASMRRDAFSSFSSASSSYRDEMQIFEVFDLEPGGLPGSPASAVTSRPSQSAYKPFVDSFPASLPSLTPTVHDLTDVVLRPLTDHIKTLSSALVHLFLSPTSYLYFPLHLRLLRSYLLLTSYAFKSTLQTALFSDSFGTAEHVGTYAASARRARSHSNQVTASPAESSWSIGISQELTPDGSWPPAGASLSFFLRTVIIDSLNLEYRLSHIVEVDHAGLEVDGRARILQEAEWRLGFAIRDLPTIGDAKWLKARSMEALDFLYMEYQPPEPLATLITPTILSKYHRIFAFNLRLMRVDNVVRALFRMTRRSNPPLFPTFTPSHRLFLQFRFVAHAFVTALSSYVYDTAIRSNFDAFLDVLSPPSEGFSTNACLFPDVFALADYHSNVMDDILSACLLRSGQKPVGDLLRGVLEVILEFGLLMSDVATGETKEYQAVSPLETLFKQFRLKVTTLVKVLSALVERGTMAGRPFAKAQLPTAKQASRVSDCLADLLIRIDVAEWWRSRVSKRSAE